MSTKTVFASTVSFPNQQAIIDYINGHPIKPSLETKFMQSTTPNGVGKIAKFFADKTMPREEIKKNLEVILVNQEENEKPASLSTALEKLILSCEKIDAKSEKKQPSQFTSSMKEVYEISKNADRNFEIAIKIYDSVLQDLLDGATFTPPSIEEQAKGNHSWTRHVQVMNLEEKK